MILLLVRMARSWGPNRREAREHGITGWLFVRVWLKSWQIGSSTKVTDPFEAIMAAHAWAKTVNERRLP